MADKLNARDAKLVEWLNEAYAKEAELEGDLAAHIALTEKAAYAKRLEDHLEETREHKQAVGQRIKALGGNPAAGLDRPLLPAAIGELAGKTISAVKGQVGSVRAMVTSQPETHVRNAQEELVQEQVEIALYSRIETFAAEVGDTETAKLAKRIRTEEERMAKYLTAELPRLVKDVVKHDVPRELRPTASRAKRSSAAKSATTKPAAATPAPAKTSTRKSASSARTTRAAKTTK